MIDLIHGDCLEEMKKIPDGSVDLILCDLPYGSTSCSWDLIIPFGLLWEQYNRIIKDKGPIVLFGSQPFTSTLISSNIKNFREELIWLKNKSGSGLLSSKRHIKIHENILIFSKHGDYVYNPQKWLVDKKEFLSQRKTFNTYEAGNNIYGKAIKQRKPDDGTRNPLSIVSCKVPFTKAKTKEYNKELDLRLHPTQKPVDLLEYLIKTYTNEDALVLDNCMGSGSTGVACLNTNRNFIGIEKDENFFNIAKKRISVVENVSEPEIDIEDNKIRFKFGNV